MGENHENSQKKTGGIPPEHKTAGKCDEGPENENAEIE